MTEQCSPLALLGGVALLERAVVYTLGSLSDVTPELMSRRTPCADWDLRALLAHMNDSLAALEEAVVGSGVRLQPVDDPGEAWDPVEMLRLRACRILGSWAGDGAGPRTLVGGLPISSSVIAFTGALEVAVHGWDVGRACGHHRDLPKGLAEELVDGAWPFVTSADRPTRFAPARRVSALASPGDHLLAFLGRQP